ncbi:MAG: TetR/AcrR family transcriptional regulator [Mycobacteriaceae bacterium]
MTRVAVEDRRVQLVDATLRVMSEHGVAAATTRAIAAEAKTTLATVHYCFESKQTLLREVITTMVGQLAASSELNLPTDRDLPTLVQELLQGLWAVIESEPKHQQLTYELTQFALREPDLADLARWQYELYYAECARILVGVAEATGWTWTVPLDVLSRMLLMAIDGTVLGWLVDGDGAAARTMLLQFGELLASLAHE